MPDHFRKPFELHVLRGLSHRAISLRLGLPMGTIATRIFRAKRLLRRILGDRLLHGPAIAALPIRALDGGQRRHLGAEHRVLRTRGDETFPGRPYRPVSGRRVAVRV